MKLNFWSLNNHFSTQIDFQATVELLQADLLKKEQQLLQMKAKFVKQTDDIANQLHKVCITNFHSLETIEMSNSRNKVTARLN